MTTLDVKRHFGGIVIFQGNKYRLSALIYRNTIRPGGKRENIIQVELEDHKQNSVVIADPKEVEAVAC